MVRHEGGRPGSVCLDPGCAWSGRHARFLIVEVVNGLGNRMRAFASAKAIADASDRRLVVVWPSTTHCNASFSSLFAPSEDYDVLDRAPTLDARRARFYDYTSEAGKDAVLSVADGKEAVFVRSAFALRSDAPVRDGRAIPRAAASLLPSEEVATSIEALTEEGGFDVAVHVRMECDQTRDVPGLSPSELDDMNRAVSYREKCHWRHFVAPLRAVAPARAIVAADTRGVASLLLSEAGVEGGVALEAPRRCYGAWRRQTECQRHALAHLVVLSRARRVLVVSRWSSYSEAIHLLSPPDRTRVDGCALPTPVLPPLSPSKEDSSVTAIVACRDRATHAEMLSHARSALRARGGAWQIVVVDWGSAVPVRLARGEEREGDEEGGPVAVVRVVNESSWNLAQAYNLAASRARHSHLLKLDCDTRLLRVPPLPSPGTFSTGSWSAPGEASHLNGLVFVARSAFLSVGGYDERLHWYGWDDSDLYARLEGVARLRRVHFPDGVAEHMPHSDAKRALPPSLSSPHPRFDLEALTQHNRICIGTEWWNASFERAEYRQLLYEPDSLLRVSGPVPIDRSPSCDARLARVVVARKLFRGKAAFDRAANRAFWKRTLSPWSTPLDLLRLLGPDRPPRDAARCLADWERYDRSPSCERVAASFLRSLVRPGRFPPRHAPASVVR